MSARYDPVYADDSDETFYMAGYGTFPRALAGKAWKLFRARDDIRAVEGERSVLAEEIDTALRGRSLAFWQKEIEPKVAKWYVNNEGTRPFGEEENEGPSA